MMLPPRRLVTFSTRVYSLLLYLYPAPFRRDYGYHMAQLFRDDLRDTLRGGGMWAGLGLWLLAIVDLLKTAFAEHVWEVFHMPVEKLTRWSGPAGALGGVLYALGVVSIVNGVTLIILAALITAPLLGLGLYGLYRRLPPIAGRLHTLAFSASLVGLFMSHVVSAAVIWLDTSEGLWIMLVFGGLWVAGLAGMAIIALARQALGRWSFTPLLVLVATLSLFSLLGNDTFSLLWIVLLIAYAVSWVLLGAALWQASGQPEPPETGLFA